MRKQVLNNFGAEKEDRKKEMKLFSPTCVGVKKSKERNKKGPQIIEGVGTTQYRETAMTISVKWPALN